MCFGHRFVLVTTISIKKSKRKLQIDERTSDFKSGLEMHRWAELVERFRVFRVGELYNLSSRPLRTILDFHLDFTDQVSALKEEDFE